MQKAKTLQLILQHTVSFAFLMELHFKADIVMSLQENIAKTLQQQDFFQQRPG